VPQRRTSRRRAPSSAVAQDVVGSPCPRPCLSSSVPDPAPFLARTSHRASQDMDDDGDGGRGGASPTCRRRWQARPPPDLASEQESPHRADSIPLASRLPPFAVRSTRTRVKRGECLHLLLILVLIALCSASPAGARDTPRDPHTRLRRLTSNHPRVSVVLSIASRSSRTIAKSLY
jgi:hypothetical protein